MISPSLQCSYSRIFAIKYIERHLTGALSWLGGEVLHTHQVHAEGRWPGSGNPAATVARGGPLPATRLGLLQPGSGLPNVGLPPPFNSAAAGEKAAVPAAKDEPGSFLSEPWLPATAHRPPRLWGWGSALQTPALPCVWVRAVVGWVIHIAYACSV